MKSDLSPIRFIAPLVMLWVCGFARADINQTLFVLMGDSRILQYKLDNAGTATLKKAYDGKDLPGVFPANSIKITSGNLLRVLDKSRHQTGCFHYEGQNQNFQPYNGDPGKPTDPDGRILEKPSLDETFRGEGSLYSSPVYGGYVEETALEQFRSRPDDYAYRDFFMLEGAVFGCLGDHIDQLSDQNGSALPAARKALELSGSDLIASAVSPWREAFIADSGKKVLQRVVYRNGALKSNGTLFDQSLTSPSSLEFSRTGELFAANGADGPHGVLRFTFALQDFVDWVPQPHGAIDVGGAGASCLAMAKPAGFVISEKDFPLVKVKSVGHHYGISQGVLFYSEDLPEWNFVQNSEKASLGLVEYEPGGHTLAHEHPNTEQMEIVISGRALWEVGEFEREVGPGDVIFTPRYVKHGYKVLGDKPFRFYQAEWEFKP